MCDLRGDRLERRDFAIEGRVLASCIVDRRGIGRIQQAIGVERKHGARLPRGAFLWPEAGYNHAIAVIMTNAAFRTGEKVTFNEKKQDVIAGGDHHYTGVQGALLDTIERWIRKTIVA